MSLKYTAESDVQISRQEGFRISTVNTVIKRLIANDNSFFGEDVSPGIWERRWYNDRGNKSLYYRKGDAVWVNTEQADEFVMAHIADIDSYAQEYAPARYQLQSLSAANDLAGVYRLYRDMALGRGDFAKLGPIYYLGNLLDSVQIRVSLSDDNDKEPSNGKYWADFFDRSRNKNFYTTQILSASDEQLSAAYDRHLINYHLSGLSGGEDEYRELYGKYLQIDLANAQKTQKFVNHAWYQEDMTGFDHAIRFIAKKMGGGQYQWFRLWKSGLLEHGGMVKVSGGAHDCGVNNQTARIYRVPFQWEYDGKKAPIYDFPPAGIAGFYSHDSKITTGTGNPIDLTVDMLGQAKRYVVDVSPVQSLGAQSAIGPYPVCETGRFTHFPGKDVLNINNHSFSFHYADGIQMYSYYVKGFTVNKTGGY